MIPVAVTAAVVDAAQYFGRLFATIVPLFVVASFLVGLVQEYLSPGQVQAALERRDEGSGNVAAAGVGAVTPFCSCSSVPLVAGLLQAEAPLGIVFSFLLASPLINEIAVPLLAGLFGLRVALLYVAITVTAAVAGGLVVSRLAAFEDHVDAAGVATFRAGTETLADGGAAAPAPGASVSHGDRVRNAAGRSRALLYEMLPYVTLGVVAAALVHGVVPVEWLRSLLGPENPLAVPLAVLAGVPLYFSLSATLPVAAALVEAGIPIGTVLALLVGIVGVSLPNLVMLSKLFSRRLLGLYLVAVVSVGLVVGAAFNALPL